MEEGTNRKRIRVVLVGSEYDQNVGYVCRIMKNFGFSELYLVNPKCKLGEDAVMYSKHALDVLKKARVVKTIEEATKGCNFAIGTTGITWRNRRTFRNPIYLRDLKKKGMKERLKGNVAFLFGSEGIGLSEEELDKCDLLITIPTNMEYPVMNLSHAVAVVLYEMCEINPTTMVRAGGEDKKNLEKVFNELVDVYADEMNNPKKVKLAFKRLLGKALISDKESVSILSVFQRWKKEITKTNRANK